VFNTITNHRALHYTVFILFRAHAGQRSLATMSKLIVGQFRAALQLEKPVLHVKSSQDKIKMEHYVPVHPHVIDALQPLLDGRGENTAMFCIQQFQSVDKNGKKSVFHVFQAILY